MRLMLRSAVSAIALLLTTSTLALAGDDGDVTFRLTIRGTPVATDTFTLAVNSSDGTILSPGILCGPSEPNAGQPRSECEARNYDFHTSSPVGTELDYTFARDEDYDGSVDGAEILHTGTVTITASAQLVTLVYDYSPGSLPDTASADHGISSTAALATVAMVSALLLATARRRQAEARRAMGANGR